MYRLDNSGSCAMLVRWANFTSLYHLILPLRLRNNKQLKHSANVFNHSDLIFQEGYHLVTRYGSLERELGALLAPDDTSCTAGDAQ